MTGPVFMVRARSGRVKPTLTHYANKARPWAALCGFHARRGWADASPSAGVCGECDRKRNGREIVGWP